jgi:hypothetical protein
MRLQSERNKTTLSKKGSVSVYVTVITSRSFYRTRVLWLYYKSFHLKTANEQGQAARNQGYGSAILGVTIVISVVMLQFAEEEC